MTGLTDSIMNPTSKVTVTAQVLDEMVKAEYEGGAYVSLTFGDLRLATEVINVWDDERGKPEITFTVSGVAGALDEWMTTQQRDNPGWYDQYIENGRYDER